MRLCSIYSAVAISLAITSPAAGLGAQPTGYGPGTARYRVLTSGHGTRDQLGQRQSVDYETRQVLTVTLASATADTLSLSLTLDSLAGRLSNGVAIPEGNGVRFTVDAMISRFGDVYRSALRADGTKKTTGVDADEVARFLPPVRAIVRPGSRWSDTVIAPTTQLGMELARQMVTNYEVLGDTLIEGARAWRISRTSRSTVSGEGSSMGQKISLRAEASGVGLVLLSDRGAYLGGETRDQVRSTVLIGDPGVAIAESQTLHTRVVKIP